MEVTKSIASFEKRITSRLLDIFLVGTILFLLSYFGFQQQDKMYDPNNYNPFFDFKQVATMKAELKAQRAGMFLSIFMFVFCGLYMPLGYFFKGSLGNRKDNLRIEHLYHKKLGFFRYAGRYYFILLCWVSIVFLSGRLFSETTYYINFCGYSGISIYFIFSVYLTLNKSKFTIHDIVTKTKCIYDKG